MTQSAIESIAKYKGYISNNPNNDQINSYTVENYINKTTSNIVDDLDNKGLEVITLGDGEKIINQYPSVGTTVLTGEKVFLITNAKKITMPNLIGFSRIEAIALLDLLDVDYEINGYGFVTEQSIKVGEAIQEKLKLTLEQKYEDAKD